MQKFNSWDTKLQLAIALAPLSFLVGVSLAPTSTVPYYTDVSHVNTSEATTIYSNANTDVSYRIYLNEQPPVTLGETLLLKDNLTCIVTSLNTSGCIVKPSNPSYGYEGFSNAPVLKENGETIGYVSSSYKNGNLYIIWR